MKLKKNQKELNYYIITKRAATVHYNHCVSPSISYQLEKMLITIVPHGIFHLVNLVKSLLCTTALFGGRCFAEHQLGQSWSVSKNAHKS